MINLRFESEALSADTFQVLRFDGEEEISHLFRFELQLVSRDPDIDFEKVLESHARLAITTQGNTRYVQGMLSEFEQGGEWQSGIYEYRAVLVPRLWMMTQSQQNQIFQNQAVPDIIQSELDDLGDKGGHPLVQLGLGVADYEIYMESDYEEREYVVQYKESDFNFISRLMEHEGIYYYFEHDETKEKVVITDAMATQESPGEVTAMYLNDEAARDYDKSVVYKLSRSQKQVPGSVLVKDYNYRRPDLPVQATSDVAMDGVGGIGFVTEFGAHFKFPEEGEQLAAIRAQEYRCRQNIYTGESNIAGFSCGGGFSLKQHFHGDYNQDYMVTRVVHHGSQDIESWENVGGTRYYNQYSCIPADVPYRPLRLTPKPKLYGIMNGVIDSEQDMNRADIDEQGRYKVMMPFDISGAAPGKASRRIRMAQPYGGGGAGMSFPLVKGTEVIWTCIDGDPDRPIITGVVPNPLNPSVTNTGNNTSNVIKTTSGILMCFNDGAGVAARAQSASGDGIAAQQQNQTTEGRDIPSPFSSGRTTQEISLQQQESLALSDSWKEGEDIYEDDTNYQVMVPHGSKKAYLRMGANCGDETITDVDISAGTGWVDYTDGDRLTVTQGKKIEYINGGDYNLNISSGALMESNASLMWHDSFTNVGGGVWRRFTVDWTCESHISLGDSEELIGGAKFEGFVGLATGVDLGGSLTGSLAANVAVNGGYDFSFGSTLSNEQQENRLEITTNDHEMSAGKRVKVNVKPTNEAAVPVTNRAAIAGVTAIGAVATAAVAGVPAIVEAVTGTGESTGNTILNSSLTGVGYGAATALHASLCAKALAGVAAHKLDGAEAVELDMSGKPPVIRLGIGSGMTSAAMPGIDISSTGITIGFGDTSQIKITPAGIEFIAPTGKTTVHSTHFEVSSNTTTMKSVATTDVTATAGLTLKGATISSTGTATTTLS